MRPVCDGKGQCDGAGLRRCFTRFCQQYSDKAASEWINQYVVEDVRHALKSTTLTIKEISDSLGFASISHFGSYVRRHFGMSPSKVREEAS